MKKLLLLTFSLMLLLGSSNYLKAQYVGSQACQICHSANYNDWAASGHPYKFNVIHNNQPPVYPPEAINFQTQWMDSLGNGTHGWAQIAGVIGGYGWKARFVGDDGKVVGTVSSAYSAGFGHNQFNFYGGEDHGWVDYHPNDEKIYNYSCFKCHTTGGSLEGSWLDGVDGLGTFTEQGIGCESCHGPGGAHTADPSSQNIDLVYEFAHLDNSLGGLEVDGVVITPDPDKDRVNFLCGTCHNRSYTDPINSSGGFIKHHEQWDEMMATSHVRDEEMSCSDCHNPHKRVIWEGDGITATCSSCHSGQANVTNHAAGVSCIDCHMPFAAKSGTKRGQSGYKGDVRSHLFKIIADTAWMFSADGSVVRDDEDRPAALSLHFACLGCHNDDPDDNIPDKTIEAAALAAADMHSSASIASLAQINVGVYPNPSHGPTSISFTLHNSEDVTLEIFNSSGQLVYSQSGMYMSEGKQVVRWNGYSNTGNDILPGYYLVKVTAGSMSATQKMILM